MPLNEVKMTMLLETNKTGQLPRELRMVMQMKN